MGESFRHSHLLGTVIDVQVRTVDPDSCGAFDRTIVDEIRRLEAVFSACS